MEKLIYIQKAKTKDFVGKNHDFFIKFFNSIDDSVISEGGYYKYDEFERIIYDQKPERLVIAFEIQEELDYIINHIFSFVNSLSVVTKPNRKYDFKVFEKCSELETIQFNWNTKQDCLWDVKKNKKLKNFELIDYYNISDFDIFRNSTIEVLNLYGCNGLSSFTSKMHIKDLSFILDLPNLRELRLDIIKDNDSSYYLNLLNKCTNLGVIYIPDNFFTFNQFAWLKAHLPNVNGLACVFDGKEFYSIIGRRTPKNLNDISKTFKYQKKYDLLVKKYKNDSIPPLDSDK